MRKRQPWRPNNEITQAYNDGAVDIYTVADTAQPGYQPKLQAEHKYHLRFAEQRLGLNRIYMARQDHVQILKVIRVPKVDITTQDVAVTHDGNRYSIDTVQEAMGVYPPSLDLSLKAITHKTEVAFT